MKKFFSTILIFWFLGSMVWAQEDPASNRHYDFGIAAGDNEGSFSASFHLERLLGVKGKFYVGAGLRFTSYFGGSKHYITAPAMITSGSTGPGVFFKENIDVNIDSFLVSSPQVNALNILVDIGYHFTDRFEMGFSIDAIGFSFGGKKTGNYINGNFGANEAAKPTGFNILLISDNDRGSLNSEFFGRYHLNNKWALKAGLQFLFTEYTAESEVQQLPEPNDRFRYKSLMFMAGATLKL